MVFSISVVARVTPSGSTRTLLLPTTLIENTILPTDHPSNAPVTTELSFEFATFAGGMQPAVSITAERITWPGAPEGVGANVSDIEVVFTDLGTNHRVRVPGSQLISTIDANGSGTVKAPIPDAITLGLSSIQIERNQNETRPGENGTPDGSLTSCKPFSPISNNPTSNVVPNRFLIARITRCEWNRSPSK